MIPSVDLLSQSQSPEIIPAVHSLTPQFPPQRRCSANGNSVLGLQSKRLPTVQPTFFCGPWNSQEQLRDLSRPPQNSRSSAGFMMPSEKIPQCINSPRWPLPDSGPPLFRPRYRVRISARIPYVLYRVPLSRQGRIFVPLAYLSRELAPPLGDRGSGSVSVASAKWSLAQSPGSRATLYDCWLGGTLNSYILATSATSSVRGLHGSTACWTSWVFLRRPGILLPLYFRCGSLVCPVSMFLCLVVSCRSFLLLCGSWLFFASWDRSIWLEFRGAHRRWYQVFGHGTVFCPNISVRLQMSEEWVLGATAHQTDGHCFTAYQTLGEVLMKHRAAGPGGVGIDFSDSRAGVSNHFSTFGPSFPWRCPSRHLSHHGRCG